MDDFFVETRELSDQRFQTARETAEDRLVLRVAERQISERHASVLSQADAVEILTLSVDLLVNLDQFRNCLQSTQLTDRVAVIFLKR